MANMALGGLQTLFDLVSTDIFKGRNSLFKPYIDYLYELQNKSVTSWEDLKDIMHPEVRTIFNV